MKEFEPYTKYHLRVRRGALDFTEKFYPSKKLANQAFKRALKDPDVSYAMVKKIDYKCESFYPDKKGGATIKE